MAGVGHHHVHELAVVERAGLAQDGLRALVEAGLGEEGRRGIRVVVVHLPSGGGARSVQHVGLGVVRPAGRVGDAEAEELQQLAAVVLVDPALAAVLPREEAQHRRPLADLVHEVAEVGRRVRRQVRVPAEEGVLLGHQLRRGDLVALGGEVPVEEQGEALHQGVAGADHLVAPGQHQVGVRLVRAQGRPVAAPGGGPAAGPWGSAISRSTARCRLMPLKRFAVGVGGAEAGAPHQAVDHQLGQRDLGPAGRRLARALTARR